MIPFRFDEVGHVYSHPTTGEVFPSITQILKAAGLIDVSRYTDDHRDRGTIVHDLTAEYDLGAFGTLEAIDDLYRGYLLGWVRLRQLQPMEILAVEDAHVHTRWRFAGRLDRVIRLGGRLGVLDIKSGHEADWHRLQTALQARLAADVHYLPETAIARWACYLKADGRYKLVEHTRIEDFLDTDAILAAHRRAA